MPTGPSSLQQLLERSSGIAFLLHRSRAQRELLLHIKEALDPELKKQVVAALENGTTLMLFVRSPAWASRLRFASRQLRSRLKQSGSSFTKIKVRVLPETPGQSPRRTQFRCLNRDNADLIGELAKNIEDEPLRLALQRLSRHGRHGG